MSRETAIAAPPAASTPSADHAARLRAERPRHLSRTTAISLGLHLALLWPCTWAAQTLSADTEDVAEVEDEETPSTPASRRASSRDRAGRPMETLQIVSLGDPTPISGASAEASTASEATAQRASEVNTPTPDDATVDASPDELFDEALLETDELAALLAVDDAGPIPWTPARPSTALDAWIAATRAPPAASISRSDRSAPRAAAPDRARGPAIAGTEVEPGAPVARAPHGGAGEGRDRGAPTLGAPPSPAGGAVAAAASAPPTNDTPGPWAPDADLPESPLAAPLEDVSADAVVDAAAPVDPATTEDAARADARDPAPATPASDAIAAPDVAATPPATAAGAASAADPDAPPPPRAAARRAPNAPRTASDRARARVRTVADLLAAQTRRPTVRPPPPLPDPTVERFLHVPADAKPALTTPETAAVGARDASAPADEAGVVTGLTEGKRTPAAVMTESRAWSPGLPQDQPNPRDSRGGAPVPGPREQDAENPDPKPPEEEPTPAEAAPEPPPDVEEPEPAPRPEPDPLPEPAQPEAEATVDATAVAVAPLAASTPVADAAASAPSRASPASAASPAVAGEATGDERPLPAKPPIAPSIETWVPAIDIAHGWVPAAGRVEEAEETVPTPSPRARAPSAASMASSEAPGATGAARRLRRAARAAAAALASLAAPPPVAEPEPPPPEPVPPKPEKKEVVDPVAYLQQLFGWGAKDEEDPNPRAADEGVRGAQSTPDASSRLVLDTPRDAPKARASARGTPLGTYLAIIEEKILTRWMEQEVSPQRLALAQTGEVVVEFYIPANGKIQAPRVIRGTGDPWLDHLALAAVPAKLPRFPPDLGLEGLHHRLILRYRAGR
jgi:TonB family protein